MISNQELLHAVVGLIRVCLPGLTVNGTYHYVCRRNSYAIILVRDLEDTIQHFTEEKTTQGEQEKVDDDDDDEDIDPEKDVLTKEDSTKRPSIFKDVFSDVPCYEYTPEDEEEEEERHYDMTYISFLAVRPQARNYQMGQYLISDAWTQTMSFRTSKDTSTQTISFNTSKDALTQTIQYLKGRLDTKSFNTPKDTSMQTISLNTSKDTSTQTSFNTPKDTSMQTISLDTSKNASTQTISLNTSKDASTQTTIQYLKGRLNTDLIQHPKGHLNADYLIQHLKERLNADHLIQHPK
ncbi:hypothetical protein ACOMHN_026003 [Nucella lapillus]